MRSALFIALIVAALAVLSGVLWKSGAAVVPERDIRRRSPDAAKVAEIAAPMAPVRNAFVVDQIANPQPRVSYRSYEVARMPFGKVYD